MPVKILNGICFILFNIKRFLLVLKMKHDVYYTMVEILTKVVPTFVI